MRNKNHLHYWRNRQNPLSGEAKLLRKTNNPDDKQAPSEIEAMPSAFDLTTKPPNLGEIAALTQARKFDIDKVLENQNDFYSCKKDLNGLQNSIEHLQTYKKKLEADGISLNAFEFISRANQILMEVKKLKQYNTDREFGKSITVKNIPDIDKVEDVQSEIRRAGLEEAKAAEKDKNSETVSTERVKRVANAKEQEMYKRVKQEIMAILDGIITDFEAQKVPLEQQMKNLLINELELAVIAEEKVWKEDPTLPASVTKESYKNTMEAIAKWKEEITKLKLAPSQAKTVDILAYMDRFWELFTSRSTEMQKIAASSINFEDIEKRIKKLAEKLDDKGIQELFTKIAEEADTLLLELDTAENILEERAKIQNDKAFNKLYEESKKNIEEARKKLELAKNTQTLAKKLLNESNMVFPKDPPDESSIPKGLNNQLEFIKKMQDSRSDGMRKNLYAHYFEEAVGQAETQIDEKAYKDLLDKGLFGTRKQIHDFKSQFGETRGKNPKSEIYWVSWYDVTRGWEIIKNWTENRMNRRSDMSIGKVGEKIIPNLRIPLTETLGSEFANKVHETEHHEVDRLAGLLKPHDNLHIKHMMHTETRNVDQLKAIFNVLSERGAMRWDDPELLKLLNQFQKRVVFDTFNPEKEFRDESRFYLRLKEATAAIWDPDVFRNWTSQNSSAYESGKQKFESECNKRSEQPGGIRKFLSSFLREIRMKGHNHKVDPQEYEEMIHYCIKKAKLMPEDRIYFLIQGIATGLLSRTRGSELNSLSINDYPCIELWSQAEGMTHQDIMELARIDRDTYAPGPAYKYHFDKEIMHMKTVRERLEKAVSQGNGIDHDDFVRYGGYLTDQTMINLLQQKSNGFQLPATGVANCTVGFLNYIDLMANGYDEIKDNKKELARFASIVLNFDGITRGRKYIDRPNQYFRWGSAGIDNKPPRTAGSYMRSGTENLSAKKHVELVKSYLREIDPQFFDFIESPTIPAPGEVAKFVQKMRDDHPGQAVFGDKQIPKDYDTLLDVAGEYLRFAIDNDKNGKVTKMFERIRAEQKESDHGQEDGTNKKFLDAIKQSTSDRQEEKDRQKKLVEQLISGGPVGNEHEVH